MGPVELRGTNHQLSFAASQARSAEVSRIARIAIQECAGVRPGESVLIVNDNAGDPALADYLAAEARQAGAEVMVVVFTYVSTILDLPPRVAEAIVSSDVVIPICQSRILYSAACARRANGDECCTWLTSLRKCCCGRSSGKRTTGSWPRTGRCSLSS